MGTDSQPKPSFSAYRRWRIGFHVCFLVLVVLSVVVMVNYLSRDYFLRFQTSTHTRIELAPRTVSLLRSLTNRVKVTLYYDTDDENSLYNTVKDLLDEYQRNDSRIVVQTVDYVRNPTLAQVVKAKYKLTGPSEKNLVIFDCDGRVKAIEDNLLAQYATEQLPGLTPDGKLMFRRKPVAFLGEMAFTGALLDVTSSRTPKAYFLGDQSEHSITSGDDVDGYIKFASILQENCIQPEPLSLLGTNTVPADCNLLVIAGPRNVIADTELDKIGQYLNQGGRLLALFNFYTINKDIGLEGLLAKWGVDVGHDVVKDPEHSLSGNGMDVVVGRYGQHQLVSSLVQSPLQLVLPRSVGQLKGRAQAADAPRVDELAFTGPKAFVDDDRAHPQTYPLMVAVEKGALKDVITERGSTRIVVVGDSLFLTNRQIESAANRDFAACAVNWLLERTHLLTGLGPRPITTYRITMTRAQLHQAQWVLLGALPGGVLFLGGLVWLRRRR